MIPSSILADNQFLWQNPCIINLWKYPTKCFDNNSIVSFPEEAFYIYQTLNVSTSLFCNMEYPSYPKYFLDVSHFFVQKKKLTLKPDVYVVENKHLVDRFKQMLILNPEFLKQVKIATNQYISNYGSKKEGKNKLDSLSLKIPTYYFY